MKTTYKIIAMALLICAAKPAFADNPRTWPKFSVMMIFNPDGTIFAELHKSNGATKRLRISGWGKVKQLIKYHGLPIILDDEGRLLTLDFSHPMSEVEYLRGGTNLFTRLLATSIDHIEPLPMEGNYFLYRQNGQAPIRLHTLGVHQASKEECSRLLDGFLSPRERAILYFSSIFQIR